MDAELAFAGVARQAELLRARRVSARELTRLHLERIERLDPHINAYRVVLAERAEAEAEEADRRLAAGERAPLLGVPMALKDEVDVAGEVTTHGTGAFDAPAPADGLMARVLREAGAVILGKTNMPELAICGFTESRTWGVTRNPWNLERSPGGSSGGSAAAVAAGLAAGASASDGAGSIRIPAANCGLFGLKPQARRIPFEPDDHWRGLSANGFLTHTVLDTALLLDLALDRSGAPGAPGPPARPYAESAGTPPGKLRIAVSEKPVRSVAPPIVSADVRAALAEIETLLGALGHELHREDPSLGAAGTNLTPRFLRGIRDDVERIPHPERLEARTRGFGRLGGLYAEWFVERARRAAARDAERVGAVFAHSDVLMTPTVGEPPVEVGRWDGRGALRTLIGMSRSYGFTPAWNHLGHPAAAVPAGFTTDGLPLSVQLVGRPGDEATLISLAAQIEAERPWAERRPPLG